MARVQIGADETFPPRVLGTTGMNEPVKVGPPRVFDLGVQVNDVVRLCSHVVTPNAVVSGSGAIERQETR